MNNPMIEKPKQVRPGAMADLHLQHVKNYRLNECTPDECPAILTGHERETGRNHKTGRSIDQAGFRQKAGIGAARNRDKNMFNRLASLDFLSRNENVVIGVASGVGKSCPAQALGHRAYIMGHKVSCTLNGSACAGLFLPTHRQYFKEQQDKHFIPIDEGQRSHIPKHEKLRGQPLTNI